MPGLRLVNIVKKYGKLAAVDDLSLEVKEGELLTLLGPSGCGKTTVLRSISGFVAVDSGDVFIGNRRVTDVLPEKRGIGLVFQNYALWPHMTVFQNLAFGLELKKMPKDKIKAKVEESLAMVKLEGHEDRYPRQLSGGQQQRVALARALVLEPDILLLDEPLSNLDALLREQMRFEIAQIHKQYGITTVYVTHDQTEAMVISDRIAVLDKGRMMQLGKPVDIYSRPANKFVAGFMGTTNFIHGKVADFYGDYMVVATESGLSLYGKGSGLERGQEADVAIRPENIDFMPASKTSSGKKNLNVFDAKVVRASYVGELIDYQLEIKDSLIRAKGDVRRRLAEGETVKIHLDPDQLAVLRG
ncbi:MAG: ATP-binding cassette domain-containing protein [Proteobacteria bacterium]|nr:ATP-binding cassette domain-containing protein [Pseudomonadota bacterium]